MKHAAEFLHVCSKVVPFIKTNHQRWQDCTDEVIANYLAWFWNRDLIAVSWLDGEVTGVCLIKLFHRLEDFLEDFPHHPTGQYCLIDLLVCVTREAPFELYEILFERWGPQKVVMWERGKRTIDKAPRMFSWDHYKKLLRRLSYGSTQNA